MIWDPVLILTPGSNTLVTISDDNKRLPIFSPSNHMVAMLNNWATHKWMFLSSTCVWICMHTIMFYTKKLVFKNLSCAYLVSHKIVVSRNKILMSHCCIDWNIMDLCASEIKTLNQTTLHNLWEYHKVVAYDFMQTPMSIS